TDAPRPDSTIAASSPGPTRTPGPSPERTLRMTATSSSSVMRRSPLPRASPIIEGYRRRGRGPVAVINTLELEGVSTTSWGDAAREALKEAGKTIRHINRLEVLGTSTTVREGQIS